MKKTDHIEVNGFKFRYIAEGHGLDTLIIGSSIYYSRSFSQNLRKSLRLHFVDHRGFAEPSTQGDNEVPSFDVLLDDIEQIRQKFFVCGVPCCLIKDDHPMIVRRNVFSDFIEMFLHTKGADGRQY